jgi:arylsulfatase A-like enzyme
MTYILDLNRTIFELCGVPTPKGIDGADLTPLFKNPAASVRESLFLPFQDIMRAVRNERYKLHIYPKINHTLLFDLHTDPGEMNNLAEDPAYSNQRAELFALMKSWQSRVGDPSPLHVDNPSPKEVDFSKIERSLDRWQPDWIREKYFDGRSRADHGSK